MTMVPDLGGALRAALPYLRPTEAKAGAALLERLEWRTWTGRQAQRAATLAARGIDNARSWAENRRDCR